MKEENMKLYEYRSPNPENSFTFRVVTRLKSGYIIEAEERYFKISKDELRKAKK